MKKLILESLNFYKERKVTFTKENSFLELELYNEDEKRGEIILLPKKGIFKVGLIEISLLDSLKLFKMDLTNNSDRSKKLIEGLMQGNCISFDYKIIMTHEIDYALQHELQHVFDNLIKIKGKLEDREYRAYLAGLRYSEDNVIHLKNIPCFMEKALEQEGKKIFEGEYKNNYLGLIKIMEEFSEFYDEKFEITSKNIKNKCDLLLNENYIQNTGNTYEEILDIMIGLCV